MDAVEIAGRSDTGRVRANNEDTIAFDAKAGVAVLADGMGGLARGEVASSVAVQSLLDALGEATVRDEQALTRAIEDANAAVHGLAGANAEMGTTLVVWTLAADGQCFVGHVGDSRAYRFRADELTQLTEDHSLVQQLVSEGIISASEARSAPNRNVITRAVGLERRVEADVKSWVCASGDVFLLCSDGLSDLVGERQLAEILGRRLTARPGDLARAAAALIDAANDSGGFDNISVVLIRTL